MDDTAAPLALDTAAETEPEYSFNNRWFGCTLKWKPDVGYEILSPAQTTLLETEGIPMYTKAAEKSPEGSICVRPGDVMRFRVLARCQHIIYGQRNKSKKQKVSGEDVQNNSSLT